MENIRRKPMVWLALGLVALALLAASHLPIVQRGPVCAETAAAQPGFAALHLGPNPACIRIRLP